MWALSPELSGNSCVTDADANVIRADLPYAQLVGRPAATLIGRNLSEWLTPADWLECRRVMARATATGISSEFIGTYQRPDGSFSIVVGEVLPQSGAGYVVSCNRVIYASSGDGNRRRAEVADYVASLARELAGAANRAGLVALGRSLRDLTGHAAEARRDVDDERQRPSGPPDGSA